MQTRLNLLLGATSLLYLGPLWAGLAGFGWAVVPAFSAIFMLWLLVLRPQDYPRHAAFWKRPERLLGLALRAAVQVALVGVCFGLGLGIAALFWNAPPVAVIWPLAVSLLSIPLSRLVWNPWKALDMNRFLDKALTQMSGAAPLHAGNAGPAIALLNSLPQNMTEPEFESHLSELRAEIDESQLFKALLQRVAAGNGTGMDRRALMLMGSHGAMLERMGLADAPTNAMQALGRDGDLVRRMAERLCAALQQDPDIWANCPNTGFLQDLRSQLPEAADALAALEAETQRHDPQG